MPLEIRELMIKASIGEGGERSGGGVGKQDQAAIVAACVEQVLTILKDKAER